MTKYRQHPWPTDAVTKRQLDRVSDRYDRLISVHKARIRSLEDRVTLCESIIQEILELRRKG